MKNKDESDFRNTNEETFRKARNPERNLYREMLYRALIDALLEVPKNRGFTKQYQKIKEEAIAWIFDKKNRLDKELPCILVCDYAEVDYTHFATTVTNYMKVGKPLRYSHKASDLYKFRDYH